MAKVAKVIPLVANEADLAQALCYLLSGSDRGCAGHDPSRIGKPQCESWARQLINSGVVTTTQGLINGQPMQDALRNVVENNLADAWDECFEWCADMFPTPVENVNPYRAAST